VVTREEAKLDIHSVSVKTRKKRVHRRRLNCSSILWVVMCEKESKNKELIIIKKNKKKKRNYASPLKYIFIYKRYII